MSEEEEIYLPVDEEWWEDEDESEPIYTPVDEEWWEEKPKKKKVKAPEPAESQDTKEEIVLEEATQE